MHPWFYLSTGHYPCKYYSSYYPSLPLRLRHGFGNSFRHPSGALQHSEVISVNKQTNTTGFWLQLVCPKDYNWILVHIPNVEGKTIPRCAGLVMLRDLAFRSAAPKLSQTVVRAHFAISGKARMCVFSPHVRRTNTTCRWDESSIPNQPFFQTHRGFSVAECFG